MPPNDREAEFLRRYPSFAKTRPPSKEKRRSGVVHLGTTALNERIEIDDRDRVAHAHTLGTTRSGKTTYLEYLMKQDIRNRRGLMLLEPHGGNKLSPRSTDTLFARMLTFCKTEGYVDAGIVHIISPQHDSHVAGFNPLAPIEGYTPDTLASAMLRCVEVVWQENMNEKPATQAVLKASFTALAELGLPLTLVTKLYRPNDPDGFRAYVIGKIKDEYARDVLVDLNDRSKRSRLDGFEMRTEGPANRLGQFVSNAAMRNFLSQTENLVDILDIINKGHVLLVNLQPTGVMEQDYVRLHGIMLLRRLFMLAPMRRHKIPFMVYIDECYHLLSEDTEQLLDEIGKHGIGVHLANQRMGQLEDAGENILSAVTACTTVKTIFRLADMKEGTDVATRFMPRNYEMPVQLLVKPTVVGHEIVWMKNQSDGTSQSEHTSESEADGTSTGRARAVGEAAGTQRSTTIAESDSLFHADSSASSIGSSTADTFGQSLMPQTGLLGGMVTPMLPSAPGMMTPTTVGLQIGRNTADTAVDTTGASSGQGHASSYAETAGASYARSLVLSQSESFSKVLSKARGVTQGQSSSQGTSETLAAIYKELPSTVHSLATVLDMTAHQMMTLEQGHAFVAIRGAAHRIVVPYAAVPLPTTDELTAAVQAVYAKSPYVTALATVKDKSQARWNEIISDAAAANPKITIKPEPSEFFEPLPDPPKPAKPAPAPVKPPKPGKPTLKLIKKKDDDDEPPDDPPPGAA